MTNKLSIYLTACLAIGIIGGAAQTGEAYAASDPRFFGTYCGTHRENITVPMPCPFLFWIPCPQTRHVDLALEVNANYRETHLGNGLVNGHGSAEVTAHDLRTSRAEEYGFQVGRRIPFVFAGRIGAAGQLEGSALVPGREPTQGKATLWAEGLELRLVGLERTLVVRKDRCGNEPPSVSISGPDSAHFGDVIVFSGNFSDDDAPPDARFLRWESNRDGFLGDGLTLGTNDLSPRSHRITFSVQDRGGLPASANHMVRIENDAPFRVEIQEPTASGNYYEGVPITFMGNAADKEDGNLTEEHLQWTYGPEHVSIGEGSPLSRALSQGTQQIRLSAVDRGQASRTASVSITVGHPCAPNCPPSVTIVFPPHNTALINATSGSNPETCMTLRTRIGPDSTWDQEDQWAIADGISWSALHKGGNESQRVSLGTGPTVDACGDDFTLSGSDTWQTIRAMATDSDGNTRFTEVGVLVLGAPLI